MTGVDVLILATRSPWVGVRFPIGKMFPIGGYQIPSTPSKKDGHIPAQKDLRHLLQESGHRSKPNNFCICIQWEPVLAGIDHESLLRIEISTG